MVKLAKNVAAAFLQRYTCLCCISLFFIAPARLDHIAPWLQWISLSDSKKNFGNQKIGDKSGLQLAFTKEWSEYRCESAAFFLVFRVLEVARSEHHHLRCLESRFVVRNNSNRHRIAAISKCMVR